MKQSRRGFLGLLGGAVAAGPKLAQNIASEAMNAPMPVGGLGSIASGSPDGSWERGRIAELRRFLKFGESEQERRERRIRVLYLLETVERYRLDGLRSVSAQHKMRMLIEGAGDREARLRRLQAEHEMDILLSRLAT